MTIGEQLQLSRRLAALLQAQRPVLLSAWLRELREIPRDFAGRRPLAHPEELAPNVVDALIAYLARGDRKALRRVALSWAARQDGMGIGLAESIRALLALGPVSAPLIQRAGLAAVREQVDRFLAVLVEELSRSYMAGLQRRLTEGADATRAAEERLLSLQTVAGAVAQEREPERTLDLIAREAVKLTGATTCTVYLPNAEATLLRPAVRIAPAGQRQGGEPAPVEGSALGHVYRSGYLLVANDGAQGAGTQPARPALAAPLRTRHGVIGVLAVEKEAGESFAGVEVEMLGLLADQAAIALENARLFQETSRRGDELAALYRLGAVANRSLDLDRMLDDVLDHLLQTLDLPAGSIYLFDRRHRRLELRAHRGFTPEFVAEHRVALLGAGAIGRVAASGALQVVDEPLARVDLTRGVAHEELHAYFGVPLRAKERVLGVLNLFSQRQKQGEERARDLDFLASLGDQLGVAIDNANLLAQREERLTQLAVLNDISRAISAILDLDALYDAIQAGCSRLFDTTNFYIALYDPASKAPVPQRWYRDGARTLEREGVPLRQGLCRVVVETGQPFLTADYHAECAARGLTSQWLAESPTPLSWLGVPMVIGGRVVGAIVISGHREPYTEEDRTLLGAIANGCAVAIENARLYAHSRELATTEERNRLAREIHDTLAQGLTAVALHLEVADALLAGEETAATAREKVRKALELTRANLDEARRSVLDLRAAPLQALSLPEALAALARQTGQEYAIEVCCRARGIEQRLPSRIEAGFYRIAQELLANVGKHARATQVDVRLEQCGGALVLSVADDGIGFDPAAVAGPSVVGGFGLIGLRERVALLGGTLQLASAPDDGTRVRVTIPLARDERRVPGEEGGETDDPDSRGG